MSLSVLAASLLSLLPTGNPLPAITKQWPADEREILFEPEAFGSLKGCWNYQSRSAGGGRTIEWHFSPDGRFRYISSLDGEVKSFLEGTVTSEDARHWPVYVQTHIQDDFVHSELTSQKQSCIIHPRRVGDARAIEIACLMGQERPPIGWLSRAEILHEVPCE